MTKCDKCEQTFLKEEQDQHNCIEALKKLYKKQMYDLKMVKDEHSIDYMVHKPICNN